jgi:DNA-binding SARP family transcriptional activator
MNEAAKHSSRIAAAGSALVLVVALPLVVDLRPRPPALPGSLSQPITLAQIEHLLLFLAWLVVLLLLLGLLLRSLRSLVRAAPPQVPLVLRRDALRAGRRTHAITRERSESRNPLANPYVLTVARPQTPEQPAIRLLAVGTAMLRRAPTGSAQPRLEGEVASTAAAAPAIRLLGVPTIEGIPRRRRGLRRDSRDFLLCLALQAGGGRDELLASLWPDLPERRARQRLYQAAADARSHLGDALIAENDGYRLDRDQITIDLDTFERLLRQADTAPTTHAEREALEQALALVSGKPLAGLDRPWAAGEQRRLRAVIVELCHRLGRARLTDADPAAALRAAEQGLKLDELNEELWRLALEAEATLGSRNAVIERYETLARVLDDRLGLEPQRETRTLYLELLGQE